MLHCIETVTCCLLTKYRCTYCLKSLNIQPLCGHERVSGNAICIYYGGNEHIESDTTKVMFTFAYCYVLFISAAGKCSYGCLTAQ